MIIYKELFASENYSSSIKNPISHLSVLQMTTDILLLFCPLILKVSSLCNQYNVVICVMSYDMHLDPTAWIRNKLWRTGESVTTTCRIAFVMCFVFFLLIRQIKVYWTLSHHGFGRKSSIRMSTSNLFFFRVDATLTNYGLYLTHPTHWKRKFVIRTRRIFLSISTCKNVRHIWCLEWIEPTVIFNLRYKKSGRYRVVRDPQQRNEVHYRRRNLCIRRFFI